jgi:hypothetical protein
MLSTLCLRVKSLALKRKSTCPQGDFPTIVTTIYQPVRTIVTNTYTNLSLSLSLPLSHQPVTDDQQII